MIQAQGTGTPPDTTTDEQPTGRHYRESGPFSYAELVEPGKNRHHANEAETEVTS